jgi:osmotically-inducible protein OsmY
MKHVALGFVLLLSGWGFAQVQGQPPPSSTPPTFPEQRQSPGQQMPPDTQAPPAETMSTERVEQQISHHLVSEPALANTNVDAKVDDTSVVLTGIVDTDRQHDLAVQIAQTYAGGRRVIDKIKLRQQT